MHIRLRQLLISISIFFFSIFFSNCLICKGVSNVISLMFEALGNYTTVKEKLVLVNKSLEKEMAKNEQLSNELQIMLMKKQELENTLNQTLAEKQDVDNKLKISLNNEKNLNNDLENVRAENKKALENVSDMINKMKLVADEKERLNNKLEKVIDENKKALQDASDMINKLKLYINGKEESYNEVCKEKETILKGKKKVEEESALMQRKLAMVEENNNNLKNENKQLLIVAKEREDEYRKINEENAKINEELDAKKKANVLLISKNIRLQNSKEFLLEDNREKTAKVYKLQAEINKLQVEINKQKYGSIGGISQKMKKSNDRFKYNNNSKKINESQRQQQDNLVESERKIPLIKQKDKHPTVFFRKKLQQKQSEQQKHVGKKNAIANEIQSFTDSENLFSVEERLASLKMNLCGSFNSSEISNSFISFNTSGINNSVTVNRDNNKMEGNANNNSCCGNEKSDLKNIPSFKKILRSRKKNNVIQRDENASKEEGNNKTILISNNKNSKNLEPRHQGSQVYNRRRVVLYGNKQGLEKVNSDNNETELNANNNSCCDNEKSDLKKNLNSKEFRQMKKNDDDTQENKNVAEKAFYKKIGTPVKGNLVRQQNSTVHQRMRSAFSGFQQVSEPGDGYKNYINSINLSDYKQRIIRDVARNLVEKKRENGNNDGNKTYNNITNNNNVELEQKHNVHKRRISTQVGGIFGELQNLFSDNIGAEEYNNSNEKET